ncbi:MAG: ABC transporter permease [Limnohabitans sp.]|uniref:ABC transporter permease n=1 Tax=Limnohabitans sp. TaxID=1907725 RepID=UPI0025E1E461|nr:ABC transporter permease [Limnohabitans sp.]MCO4089672.1 ABC transporter permease [Limnohabitans sp.]
MWLLRGHLQALKEAYLILLRHRQLTLEMARREVSDRYVGQAFGVIWAVAHPIFMMGLYVFIFAFVFKTRIGNTVEMPLDYTTYLLSGLLAWMGFQETMAKSCTAITGNAALVKQVVFPLEILPVKGVIVSVFQQGILTALLVLYVLATNGKLPWTYFLLPILFTLQAIAMMGIAYLLAAVGTYFRDMKDFIQLFVTAGVYLLPIFYLPSWVPSLFKPLLYINPFSYLIWCYQDVLYFGRIEHPWAWAVNTAVSLMVFVLGYRLFRRLKPTFGNIL